MHEVRRCNCGRGRRGVHVSACALKLTLFLCGDISSLMRAHLLRVFSRLQKETHIHIEHRLLLKNINFPHNSSSLCIRPRWSWIEERMKHEEGKGKTEGKPGVYPGWLMSCWRIIPTWAGREWEGDRKGESEENVICWSGDENLGRGRKDYPPATWRRGARVVGSLWRALRADHVTMERWRDGSWGIVGGGEKGC